MTLIAFQFACMLFTMTPFKFGLRYMCLIIFIIKFCPHDLLCFDVFKLHIRNSNVHDFVISQIIYMANHCCLVGEVLDMVKHDIRIHQISPSYIYMQQGLFCSQPCQLTSWKWRSSNQFFFLEINIHKCNGKISWISIQGCC
jgi:hypothetical protein